VKEFDSGSSSSSKKVFSEKEEKWRAQEETAKDVNDETVAESGRLFVRNLSYTVTEADIEALFKEHGPLTEVRGLIDDARTARVETEKDTNDETVAESGRRFVRNLYYTVTEADIEALFKEQGPLTEVRELIDDAMKTRVETSKDTKDETLAELGRLFVRNLSYTVTEADIKALFQELGPLTEVRGG
jgi:RNA recognition motif-containing protein